MWPEHWTDTDCPCPDCLALPCVCDRHVPDWEAQPHWGPCRLCGVNDVCYSDGQDTCAECLAKQ